MKKELIRIILIASLALNLAFITMGIIRMTRKNYTKSQKFVTNGDYNLSKDQKKELNQIITGFRVKLIDNKSKILEKRIDIIELLGDPDYKAADLNEELSQLNNIEKDMNEKFIATLLRVNTTLDQEQWIKFLLNLSRGWFFAGTAH